jgi:hypothetical protein
MFHIGIVEDNLDPLKLGRLKIRVFGVHTENRTDATDLLHILLTDDLPWAYPACPITNSSIDGVSDFSEILPGTKVFVFFLDQHKQNPFYFAVVPFVLDALPDFAQGFSDPTESHPISDYLNESSISRLARGEKTSETIVQTKNDNVTSWEVDGNSIDEPDSGYAAVYPSNRVIETPGGIIIELDSTPNAERVHIYHPANTYTEIYPDGSKVEKTSGNKFDITLIDKNVYIGGDLTIKVDGNASIEVDGDTKVVSNGDVELDVLGDVSVVSAEGIELDCETCTITSSSTLEINSSADIEITAASTVTITAPTMISLN